MNKTAICIPTYKNRFPHILTNLKNIDTSYDVCVFFSENDFENSNYAQYDFDAPNIKKIVTTCKSIFEKRQYMLNYVIDNEYSGMFQIDDDVLFYGKKIVPESKRKTSESYAPIQISFNELLHKVEDTCFSENATFASPMFIFALGFSTPGKININKSINFGQFTFFDVDKVKNSGISYDTSGLIHEDVDFVFELLRHGHKCITLGDYAFQPDSHAVGASSHASTTCNLMDAGNLRIGMYLKYRDGITIVLNKNGLLTMRCNLTKYWNTLEIPIKTDEYHKGLYNVCKTRDVELLKKYITENKHK